MSRSILIVDDEAAVTLALEGFFKSRGYAVSRAFYGDQAIEKIEKEAPSIVILDLQMPGMDGIAVLKKIRQFHPGVKTMVITGYSSQYQNDLDQLKPESVQIKPVSLDELTKGIESLLGGKEAAPISAGGEKEKVSAIRLLFVESQAKMYQKHIKSYFDESSQPKYETAIASGPAEVFHLLETFKPHLVLVDSGRMPIGIDAGKLAADVGKAQGKPLEVILYSFKAVSVEKDEEAVHEDVRHISDTIRQVAVKHRLFSIPKRG